MQPIIGQRVRALTKIYEIQPHEEEEKNKVVAEVGDLGTIIGFYHSTDQRTTVDWRRTNHIFDVTIGSEIELIDEYLVVERVANSIGGHCLTVRHDLPRTRQEAIHENGSI